jgi:hypothetical protein
MSTDNADGVTHVPFFPSKQKWPWNDFEEGGTSFFIKHIWQSHSWV